MNGQMVRSHISIFHFLSANFFSFQLVIEARLFDHARWRLMRVINDVDTGSSVMAMFDQDLTSMGTPASINSYHSWPPRRL